MILIGFKSSGKTFFGSRLAKELAVSFVDTDDLIEELYVQEFNEKASCREILVKIGEVAFRKLEKKVINNLDFSHGIIALGGGAVLNMKNDSRQDTLKVVYLDIDKETVKHRIFKGIFPSFLELNHREESFEKMYQERLPIYEMISSFRVKIDGKTDRQILDELKIIYSKD